MGGKIEVETAEAFGRTFVKGNITEINTVRCLACPHKSDIPDEQMRPVQTAVGGIGAPLRIS